MVVLARGSGSVGSMKLQAAGGDWRRRVFGMFVLVCHDD
jgi:hypothetical protein